MYILTLLVLAFPEAFFGQFVFILFIIFLFLAYFTHQFVFRGVAPLSILSSLSKYIYICLSIGIFGMILSLIFSRPIDNDILIFYQPFLSILFLASYSFEVNSLDLKGKIHYFEKNIHLFFGFTSFVFLINTIFPSSKVLYMRIYGADVHNSSRFSSIFSHPYIFGVVLSVIFLYFISKYFFDAKASKNLILFNLLITVLMAAFSQSLTTILSMFFGIFFFSISSLSYFKNKFYPKFPSIYKLSARRASNFIIFFVFVLSMCFLVFISLDKLTYVVPRFLAVLDLSPTNSSTARFLQLSTTFNALINTPSRLFLGYGVGQDIIGVPESSFVLYLIRYGALGFVSMQLSLFILPFIELLNSRMQLLSNYFQYYYIFMLSMIPSVFLISFLNGFVVNTKSGMFYLLIAACTLKLRDSRLYPRLSK